MRIIRIGRNGTNDVVVADPTVSSQHAEIVIEDAGTVRIKDLNSTNGTYVNGKRILQSTPLQTGDTVRLGNSGIDWNKIVAQPPKTKVASPAEAPLPPGSVKHYKIGRSAGMQIRMDYSDVSGYHALIYATADGSIHIQDNHSTNGTYVNGGRITQQTLHPGDQVMIAGKYALPWEQYFRPQRQRRKRTGIVALAAAVIAAVVLLGGGGAWYYLAHRAWAPEKIYATYRKSVVIIYKKYAYTATVQGKPLGDYVGDEVWNNFTVDEKGNVSPGIGIGFGTGFFISRDGKVMTNKHVAAVMDNLQKASAEQVKKAVQAALLENFGEKAIGIAQALEVGYRTYAMGIALNDTHVQQESDFTPCTLYKVSNDDNVDIAIIQTNNKQTPPEVTNIVDLARHVKPGELKVGSKVYTLGFPQAFTLGDTEVGLEANNQSGEVTQERGENEYGHNITTHQGASGSPVFNDHGRFAGVIVSGFLGISQGYNQAVQPDKAAALAGQ